METAEQTKKRGSAFKGFAPLLLVFIGFIIFAALCYAPLFPRLTITNLRSQALLAAVPLRQGETFYIRFTHSLNLSDVTDELQWTGGRLLCRSTLYATFGAGIPDLTDGIGEKFTQTEEGYLLSGIDKPEDHIDIMLQTVPRHRLLYRNREADLLKAYGSGTLIRLEVKRLSVRDLLAAPSLTF